MYYPFVAFQPLCEDGKHFNHTHPTDYLYLFISNSFSNFSLLSCTSGYYRLSLTQGFLLWKLCSFYTLTICPSLLHTALCVLSCSITSHSATSWTVAHLAPLSMGFLRQYWSGLLFPSPGYLPEPGIECRSPESPALVEGFFTVSVPWEAPYTLI